MSKFMRRRLMPLPHLQLPIAFPAITASHWQTAFIVLVALLINGPTGWVLAQVKATAEVAEKNSPTVSRGPTSFQDVLELRPGQVIERELSIGETHRYGIALKTGEYLRVAVQSPMDF